MPRFTQSKDNLIRFFIISGGYAALALLFLSQKKVFLIIATVSIFSTFGLVLWKRKWIFLLEFLPISVFVLLGHYSVEAIFSAGLEREIPIMLLVSPFNLFLLCLFIVFGITGSLLIKQDLKAFLILKLVASFILSVFLYVFSLKIGEDYAFGLIFGLVEFVIPAALGAIIGFILMRKLKIG